MFAAPRCPGGPNGIDQSIGPSEIHQSMSGQITACIRVGPLSAGAHHVELDQVLLSHVEDTRSLSTETTVLGTKEGNGPPVALRLSPASGAPGTRVTVTGSLHAPIPRQDRSDGYVDFCWDGCLDGLQYQEVRVRWTNPTSFRASLVIPGGPWIEADPNRVVRLVSGRYPIGIRCVESTSGCALHRSEGSAAFTLTTPTSGPAWCPSVAMCGHLSVIPGLALPGDVIEVTGDAPLVSVTGSDQPFTFQMNVERGYRGGAQVRFSPLKYGAVDVDFGHGGFEVGSPPTWASLPATIPLTAIPAGLPAISMDPSDPSLFAWCDGGGVTVSDASAQNTVPTGAAAPVLDALGFGPLESAPACSSAIPVGRAAAPTVVAAFPVGPGGNGPPIADIALFTTDDGGTWRPVPTPGGDQPEGFGGFRVDGDTVNALFSSRPSGIAVRVPQVEATVNGSDWQEAELTCPVVGPCVTLGGYTPGNCVMVNPEQALLRQAVGSTRWVAVGWPSDVGTCALAELVATSATSELLVDSTSPYKLTRSTDGGTTWSDVSLPPAPGFQPGNGFAGEPGGITVLPEGSLLLTGERTNTDAWELLAPGATSWCPVTGLSAPVQQSADQAELEVLGSQLWWLPNSIYDSPTTVPIHLDASSLTC